MRSCSRLSAGDKRDSYSVLFDSFSSTWNNLFKFTNLNASSQDRTHCAAPARFNLLGEHMDYTGGLVMPMAIPFYTRATITPCDTGTYLFQRDIFKGKREIPGG